MSDQDDLDDAKRRFLLVKDEIDTLRLKIALAACPLQLGERVTVKNSEAVFDGVVDTISPSLVIADLIEPVVGAPTGWAASGKRINKTTGEVGKWSFSVSSGAELRDGVWHIPAGGLEATLGLAPMGTEA